MSLKDKNHDECTCRFTTCSRYNVEFICETKRATPSVITSGKEEKNISSPGTLRPSKCPKFYTNRILGEQNIRQKMHKFGHNLNRGKLTYLIQYTLTVQFII